MSAERETRPENVKKNLSEKLASVLLDCHPGDKLVKVHGKSAQETTTGDSLLFFYSTCFRMFWSLSDYYASLNVHFVFLLC